MLPKSASIFRKEAAAPPVMRQIKISASLRIRVDARRSEKNPGSLAAGVSHAYCPVTTLVQMRVMVRWVLGSYGLTVKSFFIVSSSG